MHTCGSHRHIQLLLLLWIDTARCCCQGLHAHSIKAALMMLLLTWEVNATENSRMTPDTTDSVSCTQKPIQP